jgi:hypothetical protein
MICAMQLPRRAAIAAGMFFCLMAGCRRKSNPSGPGVDAGDVSSIDGAGQDALAPTCGETIDQYCRSDGSTCLAGVARDWTTAKQQASSHCAVSSHVFFQECVSHGPDASIAAHYGVLNVGGVDDDTVLFYDLGTSLLVRVDRIQIGGSNDCIAGVDLVSVDCSLDGGAPTYVCTASDAGTGAAVDAASDAGTASDAGAASDAGTVSDAGAD